MERKLLTCIGCPMGCPLTVECREDGVLSVTGNTCKRGEIYARKEVSSPTRIVTSTVRVMGGRYPVVSVKTASDVPKESVFSVMKQIAQLRPKAPIAVGDVIEADIARTGVALVATSPSE